MITIKTKEEIETLREGGKRHAFILNELAKKVAPGVSTQELEDLARELIAEAGDRAAFLNYTPKGSRRAFPAALCVSINDVVVHGIPNESPVVLKEGDIVALDLGLVHKKLFTDSAVTVPVGKISDDDRKLLEHCKEALYRGIKAAKGGAHIGDIGFAIESFVKPLGYSLSENLAGHGVGYAVHENPYVPNEGRPGKGDLLRPGMVLAIEPMINKGTNKITLDSDGYTYRTVDGSRSAHFEHTIAITESDAIILTSN